MEELRQWNGQKFQRIEECVHDRFAQQVQVQPNEAAITAWDAEFTYTELDQASSRLAYYLRNSFGVGPNVFVPLCFEKSAWTTVSMLAVLKAGGACVSLDPSHPGPRLRSIIDDLNAKLVLVGSSVVNSVDDMADKIIPIDHEFINRLPAIGKDFASLVQPNDPAFVIYTSGSTGLPKGVVLEHASVVTSAAAHGHVLGIGRGSRVLQFAAHVFDISIQDMFTTLMRGGCICVPSEVERVNNLASSMRRMNVNWACVTPTVASLLYPTDVPELKTLTLAGEAVSRKVIDIWSGHVFLNNCYGPAESTIYCAWNGQVGQSNSPSNIGRGLSSLLWVVDPVNHNHLMPLGCVGELVVEGPLLARGYLNDADKTKASFILNPAWVEKSDNLVRRMYKTGDLVRYNSDGTLDYLGRKDSQVKIHGQRLELGEIEHHLMADEDVENAIVILPKKGPAKNVLVAITALRKSLQLPMSSSATSTEDSITSSISSLSSASDSKFMPLGFEVSTAPTAFLEPELAVPFSQKLLIQDRLATHVPKYMIPSSWIMVTSIPLNTSGKLDRAQISRWIEEMDDITYTSSLNLLDEDDDQGPTTSIERKLQGILGGVLNLSPHRIILSRSFQALGGDSITAMQAVSRARAENILFRVQDIINSQSISALSLIVTSATGISVSWEDPVDTLFELTPIQQFYFDLARQQPNHSNQSFFLRITRRVKRTDVAQALEMLVRQHSMLRARFSRQGRNWQQYIRKDIAQSYNYRTHDNVVMANVSQALLASQTSLDVENGPVFAADLFDIVGAGEGQLLYLVAHHLVIDMVSWRVILTDLETFLNTGSLSSAAPFPFQAWSKLQADYAIDSLKPLEVLPYTCPPADYLYWGMTNQNVYRDTVSKSFTIEANSTNILLGKCQDALRTEPVELLMSTLIHSFGQVFHDRQVPTLYSEGHGRQPWTSEIDVSSTIGWFTTISPLHVALPKNAGLIDVLKRTKDTRRKLPGSGWPYFTCRYLTPEGRKAFGDHMPMELLFNYLGRYQQLEQKDGLFRQEPYTSVSQVSDVGLDVPRLALFEVSVVVIQGALQFSITYNRNMRRQPEIEQWIQGWMQSLNDSAEILSKMIAEPTLCDYPLLPLSYQILDKIKSETLPLLGLQDFGNIEDMYPCSPMQQGLLLSQAREATNYMVDFTYEVVPAKETTVNSDRLLSAWQQVVNRHPVLRTVFVDSVCNEGLSDQIVLRNTSTNVARISCEKEGDVLQSFKKLAVLQNSQWAPRHQLTICSTDSGRIYVRLEISHALIDAASISIMLRDFSDAYAGSIRGLGALYSNYIKFLQENSIDVSIEYWKTSLEGLDICHFPTADIKSSEAVRELRTVNVIPEVPHDAVHQFCMANEITVPNLIQLVWALVLRAYTGSNDVCFGYLSSGRNVAVEGIDDIVGPLINMLVRRVCVTDVEPVAGLLKQVQTDYLTSLEHQHISLAQIQGLTEVSGQSLFNTVMSIQRMFTLTNKLSSAEQISGELSFKGMNAHDPTEVCTIATLGKPANTC